MSSVFPVQMDTVHVHSKGGRPRRGQAGRQDRAGWKQRRKALSPFERKNRDRGCRMSCYWNRGTRRAEQGERGYPHEGVTW